VSIIEKIKKIKYISCFDYYRFRCALDGEITSSKAPREKITLYIIKTLQELEELNSQGYDFCESPVVDMSKNHFDGNQTLFLYFVDKKLAHANCNVVNNPIYDSALKNFKGSNVVFTGPGHTIEQYRGKGFHVYDLVKGCQYYKDRGYKYVYASMKTTNKGSIFGVLAAGFEMIDKVRCYRFINSLFNFIKVYPSQE